MQPAGKASRPCTLPLAVTSAHDHARYDQRGRIAFVYYYPTAAMVTPELTQIYTWEPNDPRDRLEGLRWVQTPGAVIVADIAYTLDDAGHRTDLHHVGLIGDRAIHYDSDDTYRLTRETHHEYDPVLEVIGDQLLEIEYQHDAVGNRTRRRTWEGAARTLVEDTISTHDDNDRLLSSGLSAYTWDDRGRLSGENDGTGPIAYAWSDDDRLLAVTGGAVDVAYTYDAEQRLIARTQDSDPAVRFVVDSGFQYAQALVEYTGDLAGTHDIEARHVFGHRLLADERDGALNWAVTDALGSVRGLVATGTGNFTGPWGYEAYGVELAGSPVAGLTHRFAGERRDAETGLDYLRARWMRPAWGGFTARDPLEGSLRQAIQRQAYAYVTLNPALMVDRSGKSGFVEQATVMAVIGGMVVNSIAGGIDLSNGYYEEAQWEFVESLFLGVGARPARAAIKAGGRFIRFWRLNRQIRQVYKQSVRRIGSRVEEMNRAGRSAKDVAGEAVRLRNEAKVAARELMDPDLAKGLAKKNLGKYQNEIGPDLAQQLQTYGTYEEVIAAAQRSNWLFDLFFGVF